MTKLVLTVRPLERMRGRKWPCSGVHALFHTQQVTAQHTGTNANKCWGVTVCMCVFMREHLSSVRVCFQLHATAAVKAASVQYASQPNNLD